MQNFTLFLMIFLSINTKAKLQNTGPLIYILSNHNSAYCVRFGSSKGFDTCKAGGPKWPSILKLLQYKNISKHIKKILHVVPLY